MTLNRTILSLERPLCQSAQGAFILQNTAVPYRSTYINTCTSTFTLTSDDQIYYDNNCFNAGMDENAVFIRINTHALIVAHPHSSSSFCHLEVGEIDDFFYQKCMHLRSDFVQITMNQLHVFLMLSALLLG